MATEMELTITPERRKQNGKVSEISEDGTERVESVVPETSEDCTVQAEYTDPVSGLCSASDIKRKQLHTFYIFLSFMSLGMVVALHGPTFLDLILILNTDIESGTVLFTAGSIGYLFGSFVGGIIFDKFSKELTLFWTTLFGGIFTLVIPWCPNLPLMATVCSLRSCALGAVEAGGNTFIVMIWGKDVGPYMQVIHFAFGFVGIISPFIAEPFLTPTQDLSPYILNQTDVNTTATFLANSTQSLLTTTVGLESVTSNSTENLMVNPVTRIHRIHIPYLIVGLFSALCAFPNLEMYFYSRAKEKKEVEPEETSPEIRHIPLTLPVRLTFLFLVGLFYLDYCCLVDTFAGFLMTFVVTHLKWSKSQGALITSMFWISFSVGRLLGVGIAKLMTPWKMLTLDLVLLDISLFIFYFGVESSEWFSWVCTVLLSASMASIFPTGIAWIDRRIFKITGRVASFLLICSSLGTMASPLLVGYLFEEFTPLWFVYLLCIHTIICSVVFIVISGLVVWIHTKRKESFKKGSNRESPKEPAKGNNFIE